MGTARSRYSSKTGVTWFRSACENSNTLRRAPETDPRFRAADGESLPQS